MNEARIKRLALSINARLSPCAVVRTDNGDFELIPHSSPRLDAMLDSPQWSAKVIGVFSPGVPLDVLREAVMA